MDSEPSVGVQTYLLNALNIIQAANKVNSNMSTCIVILLLNVKK